MHTVPVCIAIEKDQEDTEAGEWNQINSHAVFNNLGILGNHFLTLLIQMPFNSNSNSHSHSSSSSSFSSSFSSSSSSSSRIPNSFSRLFYFTLFSFSSFFY